VDYRHLELATADYFRRIIAIFVVRIGSAVAESQSTPRLSRHSVSRYAVRDVTHSINSFNSLLVPHSYKRNMLSMWSF